MQDKKAFTWTLALSVKSGQLLKAFKVFKLLKLGKIAITLLSMLLSIAAYAWRLGNAWVALGFVLMIFVHEMGHVIAMRIRRYEAGPPVFIPFLGALIFAPAFKSSDDEAFVGYGGPFLGSIAALAAFALWMSGVWKNDTLLLVSYLGTTVNLFNLIPVPPLDGGRVTRVVGGWFKWIGLAALATFSVLVRDASILLIWLLVLGFTSQTPWMSFLDAVFGALILVLIRFQADRANAKVHAETSTAEPPVSLSRRITWFGLYAALAGGLVALLIAHLPHLEHLLKK